MSYSMKAGTYLVGDPCYFFTDKGHDEWINFLDKNSYLSENRDSRNGEGTLVGSDKAVCLIGTEYGDGSYYDLEGREYPVDSGMLSVIEVENTDIPDGMHLVKFEEDFECYTEEGIIHFGDISIDTMGDTYYDEHSSLDEEEREDEEDYNYDDEGEIDEP